MLGADTFVSALLRVGTTVAILAAVAFFLVKPILDTTEKVSHDVNSSVRRSLRQGERASQAASFHSARSTALSYAQSARAGSQPWLAASRAISGCVRSAGHDVRKVNACESFGRRIVTQTLSRRNFAVSYADSLASQAKSGDATRVRKCIHDAGFKPLPMLRCRNLADRLLFG
jgi:hypothetical protein